MAMTGFYLRDWQLVCILGHTHQVEVIVKVESHETEQIIQQSPAGHDGAANYDEVFVACRDRTSQPMHHHLSASYNQFR